MQIHESEVLEIISNLEKLQYMVHYYINSIRYLWVFTSRVT
jgi:hypothetical protein